uniref:Putative ovule protein n=1 Tax=Solanum chacoense TaxID=4108 RepID=A0A0V0GKE4_SOLCH
MDESHSSIIRNDIECIHTHDFLYMMHTNLQTFFRNMNLVIATPCCTYISIDQALGSIKVKK